MHFLINGFMLHEFGRLPSSLIIILLKSAYCFLMLWCSWIFLWCTPWGMHRLCHRHFIFSFDLNLVLNSYILPLSSINNGSNKNPIGVLVKRKKPLKNLLRLMTYQQKYLDYHIAMKLPCAMKIISWCINVVNWKMQGKASLLGSGTMQ